ncbi:MAG: hypothetical protein CVU97_03035 [Firmicutes bacterium HGW-Firmicutes-21]|nr:MAG: hypothetical protein CVU97_03035 [Firmicutes bacterium HGW-Firmicutes-21]
MQDENNINKNDNEEMLSKKTKMIDISEIKNGEKANGSSTPTSSGIGKRRAKIAAKITLKSVLFILRKVLTYTLNILLTIILVGIITGAVVGLAFIIYIKNYIDPEYNGLDNLKFDSSLSSPIFYVNELGEEVELEADRLHGSENRLWAEYTAMPENLVEAFVAVEDQRFFTHNGVDTKRTASAIYNFFIPTKSSYGGGSTITQQLIKNVTGENDNTIQRKIQEIFRALNVEEKFLKTEILEMYLNTIAMSQNTHGVKAAAETYFGKDLGDLTLVECAALAAIAKSPVAYDPIINPKNNLERRNLILKLMLEQGKINVDEFNEAYDAPLSLSRDGETEYTETVHSYYIDAVLDDVMVALMETFDCDKTTASRMLYSGGLNIITCLDPFVQSTLEDVFTDDTKWPTTTGIRAQAAMTVMDPKTGNLLGIVGGRGEKKISRGLNRATQSMRQCGSAIKPLSVYALAIDMGIYTYTGPVDDVPTVYNEKTNSYWPTNANKVYEGRVSLSFAIQKSLNTVAVSTVQKIGVEKVFDNLVNNMGFTTLIERKTLDNGKTYSDMQLSPLALGSFTYGVTVREMTQAYSVFANNGVFIKARTFYEVRDNKGNVIINNTPEKKEVYSESTAYIMTSLLRNVVSGSYGTAVRDVTLNDKGKFSELQVAGKTGSTNDNKDNYFAGYTPDYVACCWFGYDNNKTIVSSGNPATKLWDAVMLKIYTHLEDNDIDYTKKFEVPASVVTGVQYCSVSGKLATDACKNDLMHYKGGMTTVYSDGVFDKSSVPTEYCDMHVPIKWNTVTQAVSLPGCNCPPEQLIDASLRLITDRHFNRQVTIRDAQYVYMPVPEGYVYPTSVNVPFFQNIIGQGVYVGSSGSGKPFNRICIEHYQPDIPFPDQDDGTEFDDSILY